MASQGHTGRVGQFKGIELQLTLRPTYRKMTNAQKFSTFY